MNKSAKEKICYSVESFSKDTTIHGCKELYYANYKWKVFWSLIISASVCAVVYQTYQVIHQFKTVPTNTVVSRLSEIPVYPPLKICYPHWIYWVNWTKVAAFGMDRPTFLYSMSFLDKVYVEIPFNITNAKRKFDIFLQNFSNLFEYYKSVAHDQPVGYSNPFRPDIKFKVQFDQWSGYHLCYSTTYVSRVLLHSNQQTFIFELDYIFQYDYNMVTTKEYLAYIHLTLAYLKREHQLVNVGNETYSFLNVHLMVDGSSDSFRTTYTYEEYLIKLRVTLYQWMNKVQYPCVENVTQIGNGWVAYCQRQCYLKAHFPAPDSCGVWFQDMSFIGDYEFSKNVCTRGIFLINGSQVNNPEDSFKSYKVYLDKVMNDTCSENCNPSCKHWSYESSVVANFRPSDVKPAFNSSRHKTTVSIYYPSAESIVVYQEVPSQTWDSLLAQIGGLLGLWMGGSALSIIQTVYLCWCVAPRKKTRPEVATRLNENLRNYHHPNLQGYASFYV